MEMRCQPSYPLNSENASPPGSVTVYLSWADSELPPPKAPTSAVTRATVRMRSLFITSSSRGKHGQDRTMDTMRHNAGGEEPSPLDEGRGVQGGCRLDTRRTEPQLASTHLCPEVSMGALHAFLLLAGLAPTAPDSLPHQARALRVTVLSTMLTDHTGIG